MPQQRSDLEEFCHLFKNTNKEYIPFIFTYGNFDSIESEFNVKKPYSNKDIYFLVFVNDFQLQINS